MNRRLSAILALIENGKGIIDVGTDHGYIPVALAQNGYSGRIFASDIRPDPLQSAVRNAEEAGVEARISFLLCDGLALCPPEEVDTIVIAGMGGDMICSILDNAEWCMDGDYRLILQPMTKQEVLRYWLSNNGFSVEREDPVLEGDTVYQIITAVFGGETKYSDAELFTGKFCLAQDKAVFTLLEKKTQSRFEKIVAGLSESEPREEARLRFYSGTLAELKENTKRNEQNF